MAAFHILHFRAFHALATVILLATAPQAAGHGEVHGQVRAVSAQIRSAPKDYRLYLKRGELHRMLGHWELGLADFDRAARLNPGAASIDLSRGRLLLEAGRLKQAKAALDLLLAVEPDHGEGLLTRARVLGRLGASAEAARDYAFAVTRLARPDPEHYRELAESLLALGPGQEEKALSALKQGIERLGPAATLELQAVDLEVRIGQFDSALARIDRLASHVSRKDTWLARKAEILSQAGRHEEARAACFAALKEIEALSPERRHTRVTEELSKRLHQILQTSTAPQGTGGGF
jgi:tetratricopeptide (TPR) repeat protein